MPDDLKQLYAPEGENK